MHEDANVRERNAHGGMTPTCKSHIQHPFRINEGKVQLCCTFKARLLLPRICVEVTIRTSCMVL